MPETMSITERAPATSARDQPSSALVGAMSALNA